MTCPHCRAVQPDPPPRFCAACGLSMGAPRRQAAKEDAPPPFKCPECGVPVHSRRCPGCGNRVRWPQGLEPSEDE